MFNNNAKKAKNGDNLDTQSTNSTLALEEHSENPSLSSSSHQQSSQQVINANGSNNLVYEKLIQDYVKLKSKLNILKKAYVDLSDASGQKDQTIRKYEQEIEGLQFRNQQMTTRVEMLQKEIDILNSTAVLNNSQLIAAGSNSSSTSSFINVNKNSTNTLNNSNSSASSTNLTGLSTQNSSFNSLSAKKKNNGSTGSNLPPVEVLAEELEHKINENTTLHRCLNELELEFRQKLAKTEQLFKQTEYEKILLEKKLETAEQTAKSTIEKLQNDKIKLELGVIQLENQLREHNQSKTLMGASAQISANASSVAPALSISLEFDNFAKQFKSCAKAAFDCISKVYSSLADLSRFAKSSNKCEKALDSLRSFNPNENLDEQIEVFYQQNQALISEILKSLELPTKHSSQAVEIEKLNKKLKIYLNKLKQLLFASDSESLSATECALQNSDEFAISNIFVYLVKFYFYQIGKADFQFLVDKSCNKFQSELETLIDILDKLLYALNEKLPIEYQFNYPTKLTSCDECLVSYLTQLKQEFSQFQLLSKTCGLVELVEPIRKPPISLSVSLSSSNSSLAQQNNSPVQFTSPSKVKAELDTLRASLAKRENETIEIKEQLEKSLNELKFQLITQEQKFKLQEEEISRLKAEAVVATNQPDEIELVANKVLKSDTNISENLEDDFVQILQQLDNKLGQQTFDFYATQVALLTKKIQHLDSKAVFYYDEIRSVREQLRQQMSINNAKDVELHEVHDQLERTRKTYEVQMSTMSDHLIEVNDKMTRQQEENERLKHELNSTLNANSNNNGSSGFSGTKSSKAKKSK